MHVFFFAFVSVRNRSSSTGGHESFASVPEQEITSVVCTLDGPFFDFSGGFPRKRGATIKFRGKFIFNNFVARRFVERRAHRNDVHLFKFSWTFSYVFFIGTRLNNVPNGTFSSGHVRVNLYEFSKTKRETDALTSRKHWRVGVFLTDPTLKHRWYCLTIDDFARSGFFTVTTVCV